MPSNEEFDIFKYFDLTHQDNVVVSYRGPITDVIMSELSRDIRNKLAEKPQASKKVFAVFMELSQNILYYSAEKIEFDQKVNSMGTILITHEDSHYRFSCGNLVDNVHVDDLMESCQKINSLDKDALREYKREQRSAPQKERSKGAGIGLIHVAIIAGSPLDMEFRKINEKTSFFVLSVNIKGDLKDDKVSE